MKISGTCDFTHALLYTLKCLLFFKKFNQCLKFLYKDAFSHALSIFVSLKAKERCTSRGM